QGLHGAQLPPVDHGLCQAVRRQRSGGTPAGDVAARDRNSRRASHQGRRRGDRRGRPVGLARRRRAVRASGARQGGGRAQIASVRMKEGFGGVILAPPPRAANKKQGGVMFKQLLITGTALMVAVPASAQLLARKDLSLDAALAIAQTASQTCKA